MTRFKARLKDGDHDWIEFTTEYEGRDRYAFTAHIDNFLDEESLMEQLDAGDTVSLVLQREHL